MCVTAFCLKTVAMVTVINVQFVSLQNNILRGLIWCFGVTAGVRGSDCPNNVSSDMGELTVGYITF